MIEIKEMEDSYILDRCPLDKPLNPSRLPKDQYSGYGERAKEIRRRFFSEVRRRYGNCVLFAWDDRKIIGFLIFLPKPVARKLGLKTSPDDRLIDKTLVYVCMQLVSEYQKKGLGTKMVKALTAWAGENGWRQIEVHNICRGVVDEDWQWGWALPKWERMGFKISRQYKVDFHDRMVQLFSVMLDIVGNG